MKKVNLTVYREDDQEMTWVCNRNAPLIRKTEISIENFFNEGVKAIRRTIGWKL